jgi:hypothetical protein
MSSSNVTSLVIGLVVLALLIARQLTTRRLRENYRLFLILAVIGLVEFVNYLHSHPAGGDTRITLAVAGSLVLAAVMGVLRALTVRVWRDGGQLLMRGSWLTGILWAVALGAHLGYDYLVIGGGKNGTALGNATILLYICASLGVQRFVLLTRASRLEAAGQLPLSGPGPGFAS